MPNVVDPNQALSPLLNAQARQPQLVPFESILSRMSPQDLEKFYPGISAPNGHLRYVRRDLTGKMVIPAPPGFQMAQAGQPGQAPGAPGMPGEVHVHLPDEAASSDALQQLMKMMKDAATDFAPKDKLDLKK